MKPGFANDGKLLKAHARTAARDARYQLNESLKELEYGGHAMPGGVYSPGRSNPYFEKLHAQYNLLGRMVKVGERAKKIGDDLGVLYNKLDAALADGKVGKAERVRRKIEQAKKEQRQVVQDFRRFRDDYAAMSDSAIAACVVAGVIGGMALGAWVLAPALNQPSGAPQQKSPYDKPLDKVYHIDDNGVLYENDTPITKNEIIAKVNESVLFTQQQISDHEKFLENKYNARDLELKFGRDGSLHVVATSSDAAVKNDLSAKDVHKEIFGALAGNDQFNNPVGYALLPKLYDEVNATETNFYVALDMQQDVSNITSFQGDASVINVSFDGDGAMHAVPGNYVNGNFTPIFHELNESQTRQILYLLADNNPDADKPVDQLLEKLKHNAESISKQTYRELMKKHDDFLKEYNISSDDELGKMIDDFRGYIDNVSKLITMHNGTPDNLSGFDDYITDVENVKGIYEALKEKWGFKNDTDFDNFMADLNKTAAKLQGLLIKYNASDAENLTKEIDGFKAAAEKADALYKEYNVSDDQSLRSYISGLREKINTTIEEKMKIGAPLTVANITVDANSTAAADLIRKQADRAGLDIFALDLTNDAQKAVARKVFGDSVVGRWLSEGIVKSFVIDGLDTDGFAAALQQYDIDGFSYSTEVAEKTFEDGESLLKPYQWHFS